MNQQFIYHDYEGCPLCNPPENEVGSNYKITCPKCGTIYILENVINDYLYINTSKFDDHPTAIREYEINLMIKNRDNVIERIRKKVTSKEEPFTTADCL